MDITEFVRIGRVVYEVICNADGWFVLGSEDPADPFEDQRTTIMYLKVDGPTIGKMVLANIKSNAS